MTGGPAVTDISFLLVATALTSLLVAWVLAGRHWRAPARVRRRRHATPSGALPLLLAAEFSGRYVEVIRFAEHQLALAGSGTTLEPTSSPRDEASRSLIRRLRRLERQMRWTASPWWPSLDLWRSTADRRALLEGQLESVLRDVNDQAESVGSAA